MPHPLGPDAGEALRCPACAKHVLASQPAMPGIPDRPFPGSLCICSGCGHVQVFTEGPGLRPLHSDELPVLSHPAIVSARKRIDLRPEFTAWCGQQHLSTQDRAAWIVFLSWYRAPGVR
jgi:hypothetical protein